MTYYKGLIIDNRLMKQYKDYKLCGYSRYLNDNINTILLNISRDKEEYIKSLIQNAIIKENTIIDIENKELIKYFNSSLLNENKEIIKKVNNISSRMGTTIPIVYELVNDTEGNLFAKELYTKELFPIYNPKCEEFSYYIDIIPSLDLILKGYKYVPEKYEFRIYSVPNINVSSMLKCENFVTGHSVANLNDYNKYMTMFQGTRLFKRNEQKEIKKYKEQIIKYSQTNVFKEGFQIEEKNNKIQDVVLKQIFDTNNKIDKVDLDNNRKLELKNSLIEIAHYYVESIKKISCLNNKKVNLDINQESIINLRREVMKKLVEIEMELPPEDINILTNELNILEEEIKKYKL